MLLPSPSETCYTLLASPGTQVHQVKNNKSQANSTKTYLMRLSTIKRVTVVED